MPFPLAFLGLVIAGLVFAEPAAFSHRRHSRHGIACAACHPAPAPGHRMTIIGARQCGSCHRPRGIAAVRSMAWERVHQLPDQIRFSHKSHARQQCAACHGKVETRDLAVEDFPLNMAFCRECHIAAGAKSECGTCHPVK